MLKVLFEKNVFLLFNLKYPRYSLIPTDIKKSTILTKQIPVKQMANNRQKFSPTSGQHAIHVIPTRVRPYPFSFIYLLQSYWEIFLVSFVCLPNIGWIYFTDVLGRDERKERESRPWIMGYLIDMIWLWYKILTH